MQWFAVDKRGLGKLLERKGKQFILYELVQNAWDEKTTQVDVTLKRLKAGSDLTLLEVRDNNPTGFSDLSYAFTLFAESAKKANAEQRGRFNLGEKLVLALCEEASIVSTKGSVVFNDKGRKELSQATVTGSVFSGKLRLTQTELGQFEEAAFRLLPPPGIKTTFNGLEVQERETLSVIKGITLPTEIGDSNGVLRPTSRKTNVEIVKVLMDETAMIYEMGIPVVETDLPWHVNVQQKVPLNMDRDNVTPAYLGQVRALVAEHMAGDLSQEDANSAWVRDAVSRHGDKMSQETVERITTLRFGEKRVAYDPSDPEANARATAAGYQVVHGGALSKAEWEAVKRTGTILPAGKVTPSPKPFGPDGRPLKLQPSDKLTPAMIAFRDYANELGRKLMGVSVSVQIANDSGWGYNGAYGKGGALTVNVAGLGYKWFEGLLQGQFAKINDFMIHEFGHEYSGNHLSEEYYDALTMLGGKLSQLALEEPGWFKSYAVALQEA